MTPTPVTTARPRIGAPLAADDAEQLALLAGDHCDPHRVLGAHPAEMDGRSGAVVRALHPDASTADVLLPSGEAVAMAPVSDQGLFAAFLPGATLPLQYRLRFHFPGGATWVRDDPYRFLPTLGPLDEHLIGEGTHRRLWDRLGAHPRRIDGVDGVAFAVWAPNARRVSVVGDFCRWDGRVFPMRQLGATGVFELFIPAVQPGALYKYEVKTREGMLRLKTDPLAQSMELPPATASRVFASTYSWGDAEWLAARSTRDAAREPIAIYEVHLASWARVVEEANRPMTYREIAPRLIGHMKRFGFNWLELMPVMEHPLAGSWGYQVSGYFAPTSRHGSPDDFRYLVDLCHQNGIGVILDWVPAHFPRDDFALRRFDGTALYEYEDPRLGEHPDWGTLIFNYGRNEVRNFLIANALFWLSEYHVDGLRVDAVASMLYLDYSRKPGEWLPNPQGGRENLDALRFIRELNDIVRSEHPGCLMIAEESTAWAGVTAPTKDRGLGFHFKWNMGWMHDTLEYFKKDSIHRRHHQNQLTFAAIYEYSERFIMPLSHDEVVHLKRSLLDKMPGDTWQKFANLRLLLTYQYMRPGKKLLFMGTEIAPWSEWNCQASLDWHLAQDPSRIGLAHLLESLGRLYHASPCLWRRDHEPAGFQWIDCDDHLHSVLSFERNDDAQQLIGVFNMTPVPREDYRIGVNRPGRYRVVLNTDADSFGGSGYPVPETHDTEPVPMHRRAQSIRLTLPPLAALVLAPPGD
ncbi:MAG: 1,4-alpha-glucan branching protein GlgB [Phycisphaerae bacterium]|nr:1,4-alpha-glucan branching protein GlgB [Phycisphaerae bacterium]